MKAYQYVPYVMNHGYQQNCCVEELHMKYSNYCTTSIMKIARRFCKSIVNTC